MQSINDRQQTDRGLLLQRAADGVHRMAHSLESWRIVVALTLMLAAVVASVWSAAAPAIAIAGAIWSFVSVLLLAAISQRQTNLAATLQHQFDTWLFDLPWASYAGEPVADEEIRRWSRKSTLEESRMKTWYPDVTGFPLAYAVLSCQRESLTWDWRLRRRFSTALAVSASAWIAIGISIGLAGDLSVRTIAFRWFVPSSSALIMALQAAHGHSQIASAKDKWATVVRAELDTASSPNLSSTEEAELMSKAADVQQGLFALRKKRERVPRFIYERYRDQDEADMRETTAEFRARLGL